MIQIIGLLIIIGFVIYFGVKDKQWEPAIFLGAMSMMLFMFLTLIFSECFKQESCRINYSESIISLGNSSQISGSFFIGSGSIRQQEYYFTFIKDSDGAFLRKQIPVLDSRIFMTNDQKPHIFWQKIKYKTPFWFSIIDCVPSKDTKIDIFVPENTIVQKFEVN